MTPDEMTKFGLRCDNCRFWLPRADEGPPDYWSGICRCHPPVPLNSSRWAQGTMSTGLWPATMAKDWCGDFDLKR